jgi:hypothetical protein
MAMPRLIPMIVTLGLGLLLYALATAGVAQLQLICGAMEGCASKSQPSLLFYVSLILFLAVPLIVASGLISALALRRYQVRTWSAYIVNAVISAILGAYAFIFNFGVADNLGAILVHVPKNGRDATDGMIEQAPPFSETFSNVFRDFAGFAGGELAYFGGVALFALIVSLICGVIFRVSAKDRR